MVRWHLGRRKWFLFIAIAIMAVLVVVLVLVNTQKPLNEHMYPHDAIHEISNLTVRGAVTSIEEDVKFPGFGIDSYHIFQFYVQLNMTEIVWVGGDLSDAVMFPNDTIPSIWKNIGIGYDNPDNPQLIIGENVECRGYYALYTDTPYSFKMTVSPSIGASYLKPQI